jgi:hypothetical protein
MASIIELTSVGYVGKVNIGSKAYGLTGGLGEGIANDAYCRDCCRALIPQEI